MRSAGSARNALPTGAAPQQREPDGPPRQGGSSASSALPAVTFGLALGAAALVTLVVVLWFPIDQAAIEAADDAGWDESLLLPNQFLLDVLLAGAWLASTTTAVLSFLAMRHGRR